MVASRTIAFAGLYLMACIAPASAAGPFGSIHVGNWNGGAYTDDKTGALSHCGAAISYPKIGISVALGQTFNDVWWLKFANPNFHFTQNETFPIDVTFDGQAQFHLFGTAAQPTSVTAIMPNEAIDRVRKSNLMVAVIKGTTFQFVLRSTAELLPTIVNCVAKTKSGGIANAGDFSIPKPVAKPVVQSAAAPTPPPAKPSKPSQITGTGFVVSTDGHILTNHHVIDNCVGDVQGNLASQSATIPRVVSKDETNDLALLQASTGFKEIAAMRATAMRPGEAVIAIGYSCLGKEKE